MQAHDLVDDPRRADFLLAQLVGTVYRRFATDWSVRFDGFAQHTGDVLPDSERFKIGGDRLGRGFEVAEIAGDRGLGGKLELRRDLMNTDGPLGRLSAYGFYDIGAAWKQDLPGRESAATAGTGLAHLRFDAHRLSRSGRTAHRRRHRRQAQRLGVRRSQLPLLTTAPFSCVARVAIVTLAGYK